MSTTLNIISISGVSKVWHRDHKCGKQTGKDEDGVDLDPVPIPVLLSSNSPGSNTESSKPGTSLKSDEGILPNYSSQATRFYIFIHDHLNLWHGSRTKILFPVTIYSNSWMQIPVRCYRLSFAASMDVTFGWVRTEINQSRWQVQDMARKNFNQQSRQVFEVMHIAM